MEQKSLDRELIGNPTQWRLSLGIEPGAIEVVAYSPLEENSLIHRRIELDPATPTPLKALENAVYDNPLLLADFGRIHCVVTTPTIAAVPTEADGDQDACRVIAEASWPGFQGELTVDTLPTADTALLVGHDRELNGFLRRTFFNVTIMSRLTPLCRYFLNTSRRVNAPRMFVNLRRGRLDVVAVDRGRLLAANTFTFTDPTDAAYYIMALRRDPAIGASELLLTGDTAVRDNVMTIVRRFVETVMPVIFPSEMFRAGREAMTSPFELIVIPLCE